MAWTKKGNIVDAAARTSTAVLASGASAGTVTVTRVGPLVVADVAGLVCTGTVEQVATIPTDQRPKHQVGHGFLATAAGEWWPVRATATSIEVLGPAPAGTTLDGSLTWRIA